jgi:RimJ/RimL family protein N-acetyltransferase
MGDLEPYARICGDPEGMRYIGGGALLTREESEAQISRFVRHWDERGFGLWSEGEHRTEVGWRLDRAYWGRGLATEGAVASVRYGLEDLGLERIISIIQPENLASRRVAEKAGLTLQGETRWRDDDVVWYAIDRPDTIHI